MSQETYLGTMTFEFHIIFMCHEILIFFFIFSNHFNSWNYS